MAVIASRQNGVTSRNANWVVLEYPGTTSARTCCSKSAAHFPNISERRADRRGNCRKTVSTNMRCDGRVCYLPIIRTWCEVCTTQEHSMHTTGYRERRQTDHRSLASNHPSLFVLQRQTLPPSSHFPRQRSCSQPPLPLDLCKTRIGHVLCLQCVTGARCNNG